jgi:hypothetical protein
VDDHGAIARRDDADLEEVPGMVGADQDGHALLEFFDADRVGEGWRMVSSSRP